MSENQIRIETIPMGRLFLWQDNPRHEPVAMEAEAIRKLCENEQVLPLAKDIVENGLNPLERVAFVAIANSATPKNKLSFNIVEGNRRLCALKLLHDPELAPANLKAKFEKLSDGWTPVKELEGVVFPTVEEARIWLRRIHMGAQDGIGRRGWTTEQQARNDGSNKNRDAQVFLDIAQSKGLLEDPERKGKITTAQRFLGNETFREAMGLDKDNTTKKLVQTRPDVDFDELTKTFVKDLVEGKKVTSRMNSDAIKKYARDLVKASKVSADRISPKALKASGGDSKKGKSSRRPVKPDKAKAVAYENEIYSALKKFGNEKLKSLYYSITTIELEHHSPMISVGAWSFFETLTLCAGKNDGTKFNAYLMPSKVQSYGVKDKSGPIADALKRINEYGNSTKHNKLAGAFDGQQLHNDFAVLKDVILGCVAEATAKK
jgi:hypothetical protein